MKYLLWAIVCLLLALFLVVLGYANLTTGYHQTLGWFNLLASIAWFYWAFTAFRKFKTR